MVEKIQITKGMAETLIKVDNLAFPLWVKFEIEMERDVFRALPTKLKDKIVEEAETLKEIYKRRLEEVI